MNYRYAAIDIYTIDNDQFEWEETLEFRVSLNWIDAQFNKVAIDRFNDWCEENQIETTEAEWEWIQ